MHPKIRIGIDTVKNLVISRSAEVSFISEAADWTILNVCKNIIGGLQSGKSIRARVSTSHKGIFSPIAHFGSINTFLAPTGVRIAPRSKLIATWFHTLPNDPNLLKIKEAHHALRFIHTACNRTKQQLIQAGVPEEKIVLIPLGVNTQVFSPAKAGQKEAMRKQLGIDPAAFVIGSFQKDGDGWGEGMRPKLIKGPDILTDALKEIAVSKKIHVLLTGPARGYVKSRLTEYGIPFTHIPYIKDANAIAPYYHALDMYLASARIEGGPMQIFEAWASGVPYVAVDAGLISDVAINNKNAVYVESPNAHMLASAALRVINDKNLTTELVKNGLATVKAYDWSIISKAYYELLYKPLLSSH